MKHLVNGFAPYGWTKLQGDISAGLVVGVFLVPQSMAYSVLAGLPPVYGLYTALIPLAIYGLFGSSKQLAVGPVALVSLIVATSSAMFVHDESKANAAFVLSFLVGVILIFFGLFRIGSAIRKVSTVFISGFVSAAALVILVAQIPSILGIAIDRQGNLIQIFTIMLENLDAVSLSSIAFGAGSILLLIAGKKIHNKFPTSLLVMIVTALIVEYALKSENLNLVGQVPSGLPSLTIPAFSVDILLMLFAPAITIATLGYISSIAVGHTLSQRHSYKIQPTRESYVLGFANLIGSVFQCFPAMGGFARSAINDESGARSGMASLISALLVAITLLFATAMFTNVPRPVLSAVVVVAVSSLINVKKASFLWKFNKREFGIFLLPFTITVIFGIQLGIYASIVGAAILYFLDIYRLGSSINLVSEQRPESPNTLYLSIEGNLWYGNVDKLTTSLSNQLEQGNRIHLNMKDASLDSTIFELLQQYEKSGNITVIFPPGLEGFKSAEISDSKAIAK